MKGSNLLAQRVAVRRTARPRSGRQAGFVIE